MACLNGERMWIQETAILEPKRIHISLESALHVQATSKGKGVIMSGNIDYALWYDDRSVSSNIVALEAKRPRAGDSSGVDQCLAYLGKSSYPSQN